VLSADPRTIVPEALTDIDVEYTIVGGEVRYDRERWDHRSS
jgi:predicted amidohydrolase YtcJ